MIGTIPRLSLGAMSCRTCMYVGSRIAGYAGSAPCMQGRGIFWLAQKGGGDRYPKVPCIPCNPCNPCNPMQRGTWPMPDASCFSGEAKARRGRRSGRPSPEAPGGREPFKCETPGAASLYAALHVVYKPVVACLGIQMSDGLESTAGLSLLYSWQSQRGQSNRPNKFQINKTMTKTRLHSVLFFHWTLSVTLVGCLNKNVRLSSNRREAGASMRPSHLGIMMHPDPSLLLLELP